MAHFTFIGTGSLDTYPRKGCHCRLCEIARRGGKDVREMPALFVDNKILIDCGPGIPERMKEWGLLRDLKAIVLTHIHKDHVMGLKNLKGRVPIYCGIDSIRFLKKLFPHLNFIPYWPDKAFIVADEKFIAHRIPHSLTRFNHCLKFDTLAYAADIGAVHPDLMEFLKGIKIYIGDAFDVEKDFLISKQQQHLSLIHQLEALKNLKLDMVIFTGFSHHTQIPHEDLELIVWDWAHDHNFKPHIELAFDGLII